MTEAAGAKKARGNRILWIVLGVLIVAMVGLIVGLVVTKQRGALIGIEVNENAMEGEEDDAVMRGGEIQAGTADDLEGEENGGQLIENEYTASLEQWADDSETVEQLNNEILPMDVEEAEEFLNGKLTEYAGTSLEFRVKIMKIWVYINGGEYNNALGLTQQFDLNQLDALQTMEYYRLMQRIYEGLGNNAQATQFGNLWQEQYNKVFSEGADLE